MNNPFLYSLDNKRYYTWNYYLQTNFHCKVAKVPLDAHLTCPNRDGSKAYGGCRFCSAQGSGDFPLSYQEDLIHQFDERYALMKRKWPDCLAMAYFQSYTNTYAPLPILKKMWEPFINKKEVMGLCIATRSDCLDDSCIAYLDSLCDQKEIWIELGLQSIHEITAEKTNRQHDYATFLDAISRLSSTRIHICVHIINGFPWETKEMMLKTAKALAHLPIHAIKIHMLHMIKDSAMGQEYATNPFPLLTREEYVDIVVDQLELLPSTMIVQRLTGDGMADQLLAPDWTLKKTIVLNEIDKEMVRRNTMQGRRFEP